MKRSWKIVLLVLFLVSPAAAEDLAEPLKPLGFLFGSWSNRDIEAPDELWLVQPTMEGHCLQIDITVTEEGNAPKAQKLLVSGRKSGYQAVHLASDGRLTTFSGKLTETEDELPRLQLEAPDRQWIIEETDAGLRQTIRRRTGEGWRTVATHELKDAMADAGREDSWFRYWQGRYQLSSNHDGPIQLSLEYWHSDEPEGWVVLRLIDEESGEELNGPIVSVEERGAVLEVKARIKTMDAWSWSEEEGRVEKPTREVEDDFFIILRLRRLASPQSHLRILAGGLSFAGKMDGPGSWYLHFSGEVLLWAWKGHR